MITAQGEVCKATILLDSISKDGTRLRTFELEYPRIIHAELMTHRMFSRNAASSRAIPFEKMQKQLTGRPVRFGAAKKGMQDAGEWNNPVYDRFGPSPDGLLPNALIAWEYAKKNALDMSKAFFEAGYHKQVYNRLTEPFQMMKTILSCTEYDNFDWLRNNEAADPTLQELAKLMKNVSDRSEPNLLENGKWHLPYVDVTYNHETDEQEFYLMEDNRVDLSIEEAIKVSVARCAAVSYRNENYGLKKCLDVYDRLVSEDRKHASALEHQATPMKINNVGFGLFSPLMWPDGVSHCDKFGRFWSGNFCGWIQYRKLLVGENHR